MVRDRAPTAQPRGGAAVSHKLRLDSARQARNSRAYAIGRAMSNGFHVRRIVWGWLMAKAEKREGETIRRAILMVERAAL